jgi:hypothetical protein
MNDINQDEIIALGHFCETLAFDDRWQRLVEIHNHQCFLSFANTTANQRNIREDAFSSYAGVRDLVTMMTNLAAAMHQLTDPEPPAPSDVDDYDDVDAL